MYEQFFGFRELPFELTPNPRFLFLTPRHREALTHVQHGLSTAKGIVLLVGEAGTGKTTLIRSALAALDRESVHCLYLNNPALRRDEFVEFIARGFSLSEAARTSKTSLLFELQRTLEERRARGEIVALIVDEAQSLPYELLEEIRLLANIETHTEKLLPVILAGQPELAARLNETALRQLKQRVALRCDLAPLSLQETASYIAARIRTAGGETTRVFTREAVTVIHDRSAGIPRTISVICDNALVSGFALERRPVGRDIVLEVCRDFDLGGERAAAPVAAPERRVVPAQPAGRQAFDSENAVEEPEVAKAAPVPPTRRVFSFF